MRVTYDEKDNVGYIYLKDRNEAGECSNQIAAHVPGQEENEIEDIIMDFNAAGQLVGIELLDAARLLPPELKAVAITTAEYRKSESETD